MKSTGCLLVSWDFSHDKNSAVLLVGEKTPKQDVTIINAFQGEDAIDLYKKLTTKKGERND